MNEPKDAFKYLPMIYDVARLSSYADRYTPELIEFMWKNDWIGRNILEIGCGTGASLEHFIEQKMVVDALDSSAHMLEVARQRFANTEGDTTINYVHADIRNFKPRRSAYDLVFALNTLNYISSPRDLEGIMRRANYGLALGKGFLFDLQTISGLVDEVRQHPTYIVHNSETDFLLSRSAFDYDTSSLTIEYFMFTMGNDGMLQRHEERHLLRGYPFRAVGAMLERSGFALKQVVDAQLEPFNEVDNRARIILYSEKVREFNE